VELLLLVVGDNEPLPDALEHLRATTSVVVRPVPANPDRMTLDPLLDGLAGRRLAVAADLAGLHQVIVRLLRRDQLGDVPIGVVPTASAPLAELGVEAEESLRGLTAGTSVARPLVRDDHAEVLLTTARLRPASETHGIGVRAYVDEHELVNEVCSSLVVAAGRTGLQAVATPARRRWPRRVSDRVIAGRAVTVSCEEAQLTIDGVEQPRPVTRRTWWHEPGRWRCYLG
jgi:hypothetical protein